jgi:SAM-dependent methyltransferase
VSGYAPRRLRIAGFVGDKALPYNLSNQWIINRARTERLMSIIGAIQGFDRSRSTILVVGPRNEAELLLLRAHGFSSRNIEAIDLFTYCPTIKLMDMHQLDYADNTFDSVYSSFVITYSDDIPKAVAEMIRVAKDGAIVLFGFQHLVATAINKLGVNRLQGGTSELLGLFGNSVGHRTISISQMAAGYVP